ncbi:hypothetical protein SPONL_1867 [uncultured Candidatus Thioglobus sp.]|nr:hypothetical protein SPONL_1867 [uncultured Candidatus Thioglobus sp.]
MLGFFRTKTVGFGAYTAGVLLILLVLIIAALLAIGGILEPDIIANILLVALGFAGGLFTRINSTKKGGGKPDPGTD